MHQQQPRVNEIEGGRGQRLRQHVVPADLDPVAGQVFEQARVEVDGQDRAAAPHTLGEYPGHRAASRSDIQAPPSFSDSDRIQLSDRERVVELGQDPETSPLEVGCIVVGEQVVAHGRSPPILDGANGPVNLRF
jgi:hypothetical protein